MMDYGRTQTPSDAYMVFKVIDDTRARAISLWVGSY